MEEQQIQELIEHLRETHLKFVGEGGRFCSYTDMNWWCHISITNDPERGGECIDVVYKSNKGVTLLLGVVNGRLDWDDDGLAQYIWDWR